MKPHFFRKKDKRIKYSLFSFFRFTLYLLLTAFVVTSSFLLFFSDKFSNEPILINALDERAISSALNIVFICIALSIIDAIKKKATIEIPVRKILDATHRITHGDFSARITPRKTRSMVNELDIIIEDFNIMAESLSQTETLKTDFIYNVSHEIKTPLAVIQNYSLLLQNDNLTNEKREEYSKALLSASKNLNTLVTGILRLNKLENQQIFPEGISYNLSEQLCESMLKFETLWEKKNLNIAIELDDSIIIHADKELMEIVWSNLLSNAIKFTPDSGTVSVKISQDTKNIKVCISDTGCGMDEQTQKRIFEKFYQGDTSHSTKGNGLGLAVVKRIADITGITVSVESSPGSGSAFTVSIPKNNIN